MEFTAAENEDPHNALVHGIFAASRSFGLGRNDQAAYEYRRAIQLNPRMEDAYRNLGFLEWTARDHLNPRGNALERAVAFSPDDTSRTIISAACISRQQHYAAAI